MILPTKKRDCCGCSACANACPVRCIRMQPDEEGFLYPRIEKDRCVRCGKCEAVCPFLNRDKKKRLSPSAYAAVNRNEEVRLNSTSGGVFSLLADFVLQQGGVVFGAAYGAHFEIKHISAHTQEEIARIRGSKYAQSEIGDCFLRAREYLQAGRTVLFTGTPCQIAGLSRFLGKPYPNLYTQDLICHGVASPAVWDAYLRYEEALHGAPVTEAAFRKKLSPPGQKQAFYLRFENGEEHISSPYTKDVIIKLFLYDKCLRPSCHKCALKGKHQSDVTLADLWSVNSVAREMNDKKGVSLLLVHTPAGEELLQAIGGSLRFKRVPFRSATRKQPCFLHSAFPSPVRKKFFRDFRGKPFEKVLRRHKRLL